MPSSARTPLTPAKRAQLTAHPRQEGSLELGPVGFCFTPARHHLTLAQCVQANQLLRKAERTRPIREQAKMALRIAGIVSAVKRGAVGNSRFGRRLHAHRGGRVMALHGLHILRTIAPIGHLASLIAHERRQAAQYFETTGEVLPIGAEPAAQVEQQHIQDLQQLWEHTQWQQRDRLTW